MIIMSSNTLYPFVLEDVNTIGLSNAFDFFKSRVRLNEGGTSRVQTITVPRPRND